MRLFRDAPIRKKLTRFALLTTVVALLLAGTAFVAYELASFRSAMTRELASTADILGANSTAALAFNDPKAAEMTLHGLQATPRIVSAAIYTKEGNLFATYHREDSQAEMIPLRPQVDSSTLEGMRLALFRPIILDHELIGTIWLQSDLQEVSRRLMLYAIVTIIVLLAAFIVALFVSSRLQGVISEPIQHLVQTAKAVSETQDYSIRAQGSGHDELGLLTDGFNEMLTQIQERDMALQDAHDTLEERVKRRTTELEREIAERRRAEDALACRIEELAQLNVLLQEREHELALKNRELETFGYTVSHDLKTPLRGMDGYAQAIQEDCADRLDETGRHYLMMIQKAARRMGALIDGLFSYSRIERRTMRWEVLDLQQLVDDLVVERQAAIRARDVRVEVILAFREIAGEREGLQQALANLLDNALKFTGKVNHPSITIRGETSPDEWVLSVADNGVGFDPKYKEKVFAIFQRLHPQEEYEGTGIGLAIVRKVAERHGGRAWAESEPGKGASFYLAIPNREGEHTT